MTGHSSLPCFLRSDIFMLIRSVSCKDETNHLPIIQAKWKPPGAKNAMTCFLSEEEGRRLWVTFLISQCRDQTVTLQNVRLRKMNQAWTPSTDTTATIYLEQILFVKIDIPQKQKTGAINSVCQTLKSGFCKINLIIRFIASWK